MTDTEAKALANRMRGRALSFSWDSSTFYVSDADMMREAADYIEATEARHAEELRELRERFSEVLGRIKAGCIPAPYRPKFEMFAAPFIFPAPDPLAEIMASEDWPTVPYGEVGDKFRAAIEARGGKIVWEAGE